VPAMLGRRPCRCAPWCPESSPLSTQTDWYWLNCKMDIARKICNVECSAMFRILLDRLSEQIYHAVKPSDQTLSCEMSVSAEGNHQICNAWPSLHNSLT
jgi:hypothetical protein